MSDGRSDQGSSPQGSVPEPDWVMQTPKPIELPPIDEAEEATKHPPRERGSSAIAWLALALGLVLALVGSCPYWAPGLAALLPWGPRDANEALAQIEQRQDDMARHQSAIDQRLGRLEEQLRSASGASSALKDLDQRVAALEQRPQAGDAGRLAAMQQEMQKLAAAHEETGERIAKIEARRSAAAGERSEEALLLALGQLRSRLQGSQPFTGELGAIEALGHNRPEVHDNLAPLAASAATGIPDLAQLRQRFDREVVPALMRAAAPADEGWGEQVMRRLRSLVVVRRVGRSAEGTDDPVEAGVAHAETALAAGDLTGAVKAVEALPAASAKPAQAWLADAHNRLAAEQGLARLTDALTARLAEDRATGGAATPSGEH